jgi:hypothetical protein
MVFPVPKNLGDKILSALGLVVTISGIVAGFATGNGAVGLAGAATGVGMMAKGMEEFINGTVPLEQAVKDIIDGYLEVKDNASSVVAEAKTEPVAVGATAAESAMTVDKTVVG